MKIINAGVTAPKGFKCAGLRAGVKPGKTNKDMAMIVSEVPAKIAGTFTKNIVKAAPVLWGKKIVEEQEAVRAVVINTGIANACTGEQGYENVVTEAKEVAKLLDIKPEEVVVGSTGVIGQQLPMDVIKEGIKKLVPELKADRQSEEDASWAILTTDRSGSRSRDQWKDSYNCRYVQRFWNDPPKHGNNAWIYHYRCSNR